MSKFGYVATSLLALLLVAGLVAPRFSRDAEHETESDGKYLEPPSDVSVREEVPGTEFRTDTRQPGNTIVPNLAESQVIQAATEAVPGIQVASAPVLRLLDYSGLAAWSGVGTSETVMTDLVWLVGFETLGMSVSDFAAAIGEDDARTDLIEGVYLAVDDSSTEISVVGALFEAEEGFEFSLEAIMDLEDIRNEGDA